MTSGGPSNMDSDLSALLQEKRISNLSAHEHESGSDTSPSLLRVNIDQKDFSSRISSSSDLVGSKTSRERYQQKSPETDEKITDLEDLQEWQEIKVRESFLDKEGGLEVTEKPFDRKRETENVRDSQMPTEKNYYTGKNSVESETSSNSIMVRLNPEPCKEESKVYKSSFASSKHLGTYKQERETIGYHPSITDPNVSPDTLLQLDTITEIVPQ